MQNAGECGAETVESELDTPAPAVLDCLPFNGNLGNTDFGPALSTDVEATLHNPLAVLAAHAVSSDAGSLACTCGMDCLSACDLLANVPLLAVALVFPPVAAIPAPPRKETDLADDPVYLGLLDGVTFERLVCLQVLTARCSCQTGVDSILSLCSYFDRLHPYLWQLDREYHTPRRLRDTSPFLSTAVAAVAASYDAYFSGISEGLFVHAHMLASQAFRDGLQSLEVAQAFILLLYDRICASEDKASRNQR